MTPFHVEQNANASRYWWWFWKPSGWRPVEERRATLQNLLASRPAPNLAFSEAIEADGPAAFAAVENMGLEGIVSKRKGSRYRSGDGRDWLKTKTFTIGTFDLIGVDRTDKRGAPVALLADGDQYVGDAIIALPTKDRADFWEFVESHAEPRPTISGMKRKGTPARYPSRGQAPAGRGEAAPRDVCQGCAPDEVKAGSGASLGGA